MFSFPCFPIALLYLLTVLYVVAAVWGFFLHPVLFWQCLSFVLSPVLLIPVFEILATKLQSVFVAILSTDRKSDSKT